MLRQLAECDCKTELERLLNENKLVFEHGLYKYQEEKPKQEFIICTKQTTNYRIITIDAGAPMSPYLQAACQYYS